MRVSPPGTAPRLDDLLVPSSVAAYMVGMSTSPGLPLMTDGTLPPIAFFVRWLSRMAGRGVRTVHLDRLPPGNGSLPDLLAGAGIQTIRLGRNPASRPFRWEGWSGGRVLIDSDGGDAALPLHHGELPWSATEGDIDQALTGLIDLARLEDANAATRGAIAGHGAAWDHLLDSFSHDADFQAPRVPPLAGHGAAVADGRLGAWNPIALARRAVVALPAPRGTPPWGLLDQRGVRSPVQVVEGPVGRELLTSVQLGALEAVSFEPLYDPVPGSHWEVNRTVLDNGRVRAELDPLGQVVRLCCDGRFVDWSGPALQALVDDLPLSGTTTTTVLEDGPVRGRIAVTRTGEQGTLHLTYTVHAHEAILRVAATWDGAGELRLVCPTMVRAAALELGGELAGWQVLQHAIAGREAMLPIAGLRWARLCEADRHGLAVIGMRPFTAAASGGRLSIHVERTASVALCESAWPSASSSICQLALALATPARAAAAATPPTLRLVGDAVPWWIRRPVDGGGELLLGQPHGLRTRCLLQVEAVTAERVDAHGRCTPLRRTGDDDGFEVDLGPGDLAVIRWR
jgi:hypothetical protein